MTIPRIDNPRAPGDGRGVHDVGGVATLGIDFGPIDREEHEATYSEKRVDALVMLLIQPDRKLFTVDALRRAIEATPQAAYDQLHYYDKWARAIRELLIEQGVFTRDELTAKLAAVRARLSAEGRDVSPEDVP